jgi:hypothetical protein
VERIEVEQEEVWYRKFSVLTGSLQGFLIIWFMICLLMSIYNYLSVYSKFSYIILSALKRWCKNQIPYSIFLILFRLNTTSKNSLTFTVYNEFIGLSCMAYFGLWSHHQAVYTNIYSTTTELHFFKLIYYNITTITNVSDFPHS